MTRGSLGLSLAEAKAMLAAIQTQMVTAQIERQGQTRRCCGRCGRNLPNKGRYRSTFRSVYGNVPVLRGRRSGVWKLVEAAARIPQLRCLRGSPPPLQSSDYLNAKLAALLPFGKVAELLNEVLPARRPPMQ